MTIVTQPFKIANMVILLVSILMMHGKNPFINNAASPAFFFYTGPG